MQALRTEQNIAWHIVMEAAGLSSAPSDTCDREAWSQSAEIIMHSSWLAADYLFYTDLGQTRPRDWAKDTDPVAVEARICDSWMFYYSVFLNYLQKTYLLLSKMVYSKVKT